MHAARLAPWVLLVTILLATGQAFGGSVAGGLPVEAVFQAPGALSIPVGERPGQVGVEFPAVGKQEGKVLCLRFRAFLVTPKPAGWNPYLRLELNGKQIGQLTADGAERLINRGQSCKTAAEGERNLWGGTSSLSLLTFFGPGTGDMDRRVVSGREEEYWYVLDISDVANYVVIGADDRVESSLPNKLTFVNSYCKTLTGETAACREMRVEGVTVGYLPRSMVEKLQPATANLPTDLKGESIRGVGYTATIDASGAMQISVGKEKYFVSSGFSYPGDAIGYHRFAWYGGEDAGWERSIGRDKRSGGIVVRGVSKDYAVTRTVSLRAGKIRVLDEIENRSAEPIGLSIRHDIASPERYGQGNVYLAGNADLMATDACGVNPTVFIRGRSSSIGVVVEDNVLRLQMAALNKGASVQFGSEHFGLQPGSKYGTEWTVYPSSDRDYWGFVNKVRRDWGVNVTIPGPFAFSDDSVLPERNVKLYAVAPWHAYSNGSGLSQDDFVRTLKPKLEKLYAAQPDAIGLGMIETNLISIDRSTIQGGSILAPSGRDGVRGGYGYESTREETKLFENSPWFDCMLKTQDGRALLDTYYTGSQFIDLMVYPEVGNYQYKYMLGQVDFLMDQVGFRGVYLDQFTLAVRGLGQRDRCDFSRWDGHTVDLDDKGRITRKYTDCALVGASARAGIIRHVESKGGIVVTNGHSVVRETTGLPCYNFQETEWTDWSPVEHLRDEPPVQGDMSAGHLDTPMGLGIRPSRFGEEGKAHFAEIIHKWIITCLKNGQLYCYYESRIPSEGPGAGEYGVMNHMYPFTPVELHPGWMIGKERIISAKSGSFRWNRPDKPQILLFDLRGKSITPNAEIVQRGKQWDVRIRMNDWNEIAVIEGRS